MDQASRVLVVDDDPEHIALVSGILKRAGYEVSSESKVEQGLRVVMEERFDVVLLDYRFDNSAVTMSNVITDFVSEAASGVILLTAFGDEDIRKDAKLLGVSAYLTKPLNAKILLRIVAQLVARP